MRIGVTSDHAGTDLKQLIADYLKLDGHEVTDLGVAPGSKSVDYPDYAAALAGEISVGKLDQGVAICGTGIGMSITANKFQNVRAAVVWDEFSARMAREHNDANILCVGSRSLNPHRAVELIKIWLTAKFAGDRHAQRLHKISEIEKKNFKVRL